MPKPRTTTPGKKRRTLGWTLITLGLLVAAIWAASGWWSVKFAGSFWTVRLSSGSAEYAWYEYPVPWYEFGFSLVRQSPVTALLDRHVWWTGFGSSNDASRGPDWYSFGIGRIFSIDGFQSGVSFLLWPLPLLLWGVGIPLLRSGICARRRAMTGKCKSCGYDLAGLAPDAICPECGKGGNAGAAAT